MDFLDDVEDLLLQEDVDIANLIRKPYCSTNRIRHVENMDKWDDRQFIDRYRLSKESVEQLVVDISETITAETNRNNPFSPLEQLLLTLRFYASGSFYITAGDYMGMHKSTACKIITKVTSAICQLRGQYIKLPTTRDDRNATMQKFYDIARFPNVLGAVDGTHVKILSPGGDNAETFRNRRGIFSLNVQAISDARNIITDIVARWPGSAHDTHIFDNSYARVLFETGQMDKGLILGDSGYPVRNYLLTPHNNPANEPERLYNESQIRTRNVVERTFGIWKRRFPILSVGMRCRLPLVQDIIVATAILHNIARLHNDTLPVEDANLDIPDIQVDLEPINPQEFENNDSVRLDLTYNYFARL